MKSWLWPLEFGRAGEWRESHQVVAGSTFENHFGASWPWAGAETGAVEAENVG